MSSTTFLFFIVFKILSYAFSALEEFFSSPPGIAGRFLLDNSRFKVYMQLVVRHRLLSE